MMGRRYIPKDMILHSDFRKLYEALPEPDRQRVRAIAGRLIDENPNYRLSLKQGPLYFMMHYLMADLYTAFAIYKVRTKNGEAGETIIRELDECLVKAGKAANRMLQVMMRFPGAYRIAKALIPRLIVKANGHGFFVKVTDMAQEGFGFDVTECPYHKVFSKYNVSELGPMFCHFDEVEGGNLPGLRFVRKGTLCAGCDMCDFRYEKTSF